MRTIGHAFHALIAGALLVGAQGMMQAAQAAFPEQPIKVIVPYGPGGASDILTRTVVNRINELKLLPQPVVVLNIDAGEGVIGMRRVKDATPDGYEILMQQPALLASAVTGRIPFGPEAFEVFAETGSSRLFFVVKADGPYKTFADVVKAAKEKPGDIPAASLIGGTTQIAGLLASKGAGIKFRLVHVGGADKRIKSILGGHVENTMFSTSETLSFLASGIKPLMVLGDDRDPHFPDVPSAKDLGYDADFAMYCWWFAPKGTPKDRLAKLTEVWSAVMKDKDLQKTMYDRGYSASFLDGAGAAKHIARVYVGIKGLAEDLMKR